MFALVKYKLLIFTPTVVESFKKIKVGEVFD